MRSATRRPFRATQVRGSEAAITAAERREVFGAASFRIVPRLQKPAFGVGARTRVSSNATTRPTGEPRAHNPWWSVSGAIGGWRLLLGGSGKFRP